MTERQGLVGGAALSFLVTDGEGGPLYGMSMNRGSPGRAYAATTTGSSLVAATRSGSRLPAPRISFHRPEVELAIG